MAGRGLPKHCAPLSLALFALLHCLEGCGRGQGDAGRPEATLSARSDAQSNVRVLRAAWFSGSNAERLELEPQLRDFLARFPADEQSDTVRVLVAFDCVSRGALPEARALIGQVRERVGAVHDFSRVVEAYALLREAKPDAAWDVLEPLAGKIVDTDERLVFSELRLRVATSSSRYGHALEAAEELLAEAPLEAQPVLEALVREQFVRAPKAQLVAVLASLEHGPADEGPTASAREWLRKMLREQLVSVAVLEKDAALARNLLDSAPAALRASSSGAALVGIAGGAQSVPLIAGRSVGVALSLGNADLRRRSASLAAGLARGLDAADGTPGVVQLVSQDDGGNSSRTTEALRELASLGAAILVAGVDGASADEAARFAEERQIPVILLQPPDTVSGPYRSAFVLGESSTAEQATIDAELSRRGLQRIARVGRQGEPCDAPLLNAGGPRFAVPQWRRERVSALLVLGSAACAGDIARELRAAAFAPELALGLEAAEFVYSSDAPRARFAVGAGRFPSPTRPDATSNAALPALDWYEALGHDAALLSRGALQGFPEGRVDDDRLVRELHARATRGLATARAPLWTSDSPGFSDSHVLPRTLEIVSPTTTAPPGRAHKTSP